MPVCLVARVCRPAFLAFAWSSANGLVIGGGTSLNKPGTSGANCVAPDSVFCCD